MNFSIICSGRIHATYMFDESNRYNLIPPSLYLCEACIRISLKGRGPRCEVQGKGTPHQLGVGSNRFV